MPSVPLPSNEDQRLAALHALSILDAPAEEVFKSFVRLASGVFEVPIAAVTLVDQDRQWFKAAIGLPGMAEIPRDQSFCAHAILDPDSTLAVPDATQDERFRDNPLVTGDQGFRFYAGAPLTDPEGMALGALCVIDRTPRTFSPAQLAQLQDMATGVSAALRLHGALRRLHGQAHLDPLTGLDNRRSFDRYVAVPPRYGLTLFLLDMDHFKRVNDTLGHPAGDAVLQEVARRLLATTRREDKVFRLGGDEFALLLPGLVEYDEISVFAERLHAALAEPFELDGLAIDLGASIGAAVALADGSAPVSLVSRADGALYQVKRAGRGLTRIAGVQGETDVPSAGETSAPRHSLKARLRRALVPPGAEPFELVFQPVVSLMDPQVRTMEALIRWSPKPGDSIPPSEFVPLAERNGLAPYLDKWVLRTACATAKTWAHELGVSVNVSAITLSSVDVPGMVREVLAETGLSPGRLTVELTETALSEDPARARQHVDALRALGIGVALDDFGAGHASLLALRNHAFTILKIDRALVAGTTWDPVQRRSVRFAAELASMLGLTVVAEGVEEREDAQTLRECGVHRAQGYLFSKPVPAAAVERSVSDAIRSAWAALQRDLLPSAAD